MKDLHVLPKFADRWPHLYLEHGRLDVDGATLAFRNKEGITPIPICHLSVVLLGPGTTVTQAAMKAMSEHNCLACWSGEKGVRLYAHSTGGTHSAHRLLRQAALYCDPAARLAVVRRMYQKRFPQELPEPLDIQQVRGMEGARVRAAYQRLAREFNVDWQGRLYDQDAWDYADPLNRALSCSNACLYGICHAAILTAGYSPAIGFIHTGKMLSFVYDIADLYKTELSVPTAFKAVSEGHQEVERRVRLACRDLFHRSNIMARILPDIAEVLDARDDLGESPGEFEGRAVTLAD